MTSGLRPADGSPARDSTLILGVRIDRLRLPELLDRVVDAVKMRRPLTVLYVNVHCMNVAHRDAQYKRILADANLVYCDGTGVRLASRITGRELPQRMTGADWIHDLCRLAVRNDLSLFLLGSKQGVSGAAAIALRVKHPGLRIAGSASGYDVRGEIIDRINHSGADILLVGMGTPTQEKWIAQHRQELEPSVVWAVGALFDFVSGRIPRGPHIMTEHGLEWFCRLAVEPRKLWRRYLIGNPLFFLRVLRAYWFSGKAF